jgi:ketosteroid isomerase-like protein
VLDNGEAMEKVWAHTPYVTYVGPRHTSVLVGWDAQEKYWPEANALFTQRSATLSDQHIHVNGNLAWEVGQETGEQKMKDGRSPKLDYLVTNVYEKIDGKWSWSLTMYNQSRSKRISPDFNYRSRQSKTSGVIALYPPGASLRAARTVTSESFAADVKRETMAVTDPANPGNIGKIGTSP